MGEPGKTVELKDVLMVASGTDVKIGKPRPRKPPPASKTSGGTRRVIEYLENTCPRAACVIQVRKHEGDWATLDEAARTTYKAQLDACMTKCP